MTKNIYFIRHADSPFIFGEERTRPLSKEGIQQSKKVKSKLSDIQFDLFLSSPYKRSIQTLEPLIEEKDIVVKENLKEKKMKGDYKLSKIALNNYIEKGFIEKDFKLNGGESTQEVWERSIPIINDLLNNEEYKNVAIGTHGNIMTCILNYFDKNIGYEFWKNSTKPDIYRLIFKNKKFYKIERVNVFDNRNH